jgi:secreted trypsin-like serine protease
MPFSNNSIYIIYSTGALQSSSRIVSGNEAEVGQFPHQVALILDGIGVCGGTLISEDIVLTAGHCLDG